jgi:hypothetical protein
VSLHSEHGVLVFQYDTCSGVISSRESAVCSCFEDGIPHVGHRQYSLEARTRHSEYLCNRYWPGVARVSTCDLCH